MVRHVLCFALLAAPCLAADDVTVLRVDPPQSPEQSLKSIKVKEGFQVELVVAEPMVIDPVAFAFGADGKLWVAEMADYPYGVDGEMKPPGQSRVRFLQDTDGDGKYDKSVVFLDGINFPTGVLPWRNGVLVTAAPDIFYAEDTDRDGKADKREVLFTGFTEGNPQLRVNGLRYGLDNWVYCANGWSSKGKVKSLKTGTEVQVDGRDIRIKPDTGEIETDSGMSEYGRDRDDWGEWFGCDNNHPMWHFVLSDRYTRRNPHVPPPDPRVQLMVPSPPKLYPISKAEKRYHGAEYAGYFQSACAAMVYRDDLLFGPEERGPAVQHAFVCDPVHNLVHHEVMRADGVTFKAARPDDEKTSEFLASRDAWFRPVMLQTGPDGALWVADMYRFMIEHPDWLPQAGKDELRPYYRYGEDRGRIYRVFPKGQPPRDVPRMDRWRTIELVRAGLNSPNGWQRDTAQQLLIWKRSAVLPEAAGELQGILYGSQNPLARLHALWTLHGLEELKPSHVEAALRDEHPAVRRQALVLAESLGAEAEVVTSALKLVDDPDRKVRLQLACTLGEWDDARAGEALAKIATKDGGDTWMAAAVMSSAVKHFPTLVDAALKLERPASGPLFQRLLNMALATNDRPATARLLEPVLSDNREHAAGRMETFAAWLETVRSRGLSIPKLTEGQDDALAARLRDAAKLFASARRDATDPSLPGGQRAAAASLLGWENASGREDARRLAALLSPQTAAEVQRAAVAGIARVAPEDTPKLLLPNWTTLSPEVRGQIADVLLRKEPWTVELLAAVESGAVSPRDLDTARRQRLLQHGSPKVKQAAERLLAQSVDSNRQKVVESFRPVLSMKADPVRGKKVYLDNCAVCHQLRELGQDVGPPLLGAAASPGEQLLTHILDPNRQVEPKFVGYNATLASGEVVFGVISSETGNSLTIKGLDGKPRAILRSELKSLVSTNRSLMPDGFESGVSKQDLADLIRFLQVPDAAQN